MEDILYRVKRIKKYVEFVDEGHIDVVIQSDDLDWLCKQAEENEKLKESIHRGEERYREEILPELQKVHKENKSLKKRLALADGLIKKAKELTDLYQAQIEGYEKALKIRDEELLILPKLSEEEVKKLKEEWGKGEPQKITILK